MKTKKCPKCGKPMLENPKWKGAWACVDYQTPLNDRAPFKWKCRGVFFTRKANDELNERVASNFCRAELTKETKGTKKLN